MGTSLTRFLARLAVDPKRLASYLDAPDLAMREAGLRRRDREALTSGDQAALLARLYGPSSHPVPADGGTEDTTKEEPMIWGYAPSDPSTHWHYAADAVSATAPMWFSAPPMWHQAGPAPASVAPSMWHTAAAPPPMWQSGPVVTHVSVVHVVHHFAGPAPAPGASEGSSEGPRAD